VSYFEAENFNRFVQSFVLNCLYYHVNFLNSMSLLHDIILKQHFLVNHFILFYEPGNNILYKKTG